MHLSHSLFVLSKRELHPTIDNENIFGFAFTTPESSQLFIKPHCLLALECVSIVITITLSYTNAQICGVSNKREYKQLFYFVTSVPSS